MSKEGDQNTTSQEISMMCPAPAAKGENGANRPLRQTSLSRTYDEIDVKSISILPLANLPTCDLTLNTSALQLCKQESININLENGTQESPPRLPKKNLIDFILQNTKNSDKAVPSSETKIKWPKRQVLMVGILLSIGLISLIVGIFTAIFSDQVSTGAVFWSVAAICLLPGIFYARKLYQAMYSRPNDAKNKAMEEIPV